MLRRQPVVEADDGDAGRLSQPGVDGVVHLRPAHTEAAAVNIQVHRAGLAFREHHPSPHVTGRTRDRPVVHGQRGGPLRNASGTTRIAATCSGVSKTGMRSPICRRASFAAGRSRTCGVHRGSISGAVTRAS